MELNSERNLLDKNLIKEQMKYMSKTGLILSEKSIEHNTGYGHPESIERYLAIKNKIQSTNYYSDLLKPKLRSATLEEIQLSHSLEHIKTLRSIENKKGRLDPDTVHSESSFDSILDAVGSGLSLADEIIQGNIKNGLAIARPPGHHAMEDQAMGFCFANNIAVLANYLRNNKFNKIFIFDWDVHHGNGTENIFYENENVFYSSIHQFPFYPGTGKSSDIGYGNGKGFNLNLPLQRGSGKFEYLRSIEEYLLPAIDEFQPDFILISAGFDAHRQDPLGGMDLGTESFEKFTRIMKLKSEEHCEGRLISMLEGGYDLDALAESVEAHLAVLKG